MMDWRPVDTLPSPLDLKEPGCVGVYETHGAVEPGRLWFFRVLLKPCFTDSAGLKPPSPSSSRDHLHTAVNVFIPLRARPSVALHSGISGVNVHQYSHSERRA